MSPTIAGLKPIAVRLRANSLVCSFPGSADIAENGKVALKLWEKTIYDLVLVDLKMPELDGNALIKTIKSKQPHTDMAFKPLLILKNHRNNQWMIYWASLN